MAETTILSAEQKQALDIIKQGHNLYIGGQAGCGKSYLVEQIADWAASAGKTCAVTCTTGIACSNYSSRLKPMTIHKWSGINDGRFSSTRLVHLVSNDARLEGARKRILEVDILIIDEISMMSKSMFEKLESILRIRNEQQIFGGIQVVGVGDFLQLPPVKNTRYKDLGEFAFSSDLFFKHHVFLKEIFRQTNTNLVNCVNNLSRGVLDNETENFVRRMDRPIESVGEESLKLFSNNLLTDMYNRDAILKVPGTLYSFDSVDSGEEKYLQEITAPQTLWIKKGAKVMLLRNLNDTLVNGLRGIVTDIKQDNICVYFPSINSVSHLQRMSFTVFDPDTNSDLAVRKQFPLKLCYAITIHKAQGMTAERVEVDCRGMFQPGQLAVAIGRVKSENGLRVVNFSKDAVIPQPAIVVEFLDSESSQLLDDCSCCHYSIDFDEVPENRNDENSVDVDFTETDIIDFEQVPVNLQEFDEDDILLSNVAALLELPYENNNCPLPDDVDILSELRNLYFVNPCNKFQEDQNILNKFLHDNEELLHVFAAQQYTVLSTLYEKSIKVRGGETIPQNQLSEFMTCFNTHITSDLYTNSCKKLFYINCNEDVLYAVCFKILVFLRKSLLRKKSEVLPVASNQQIQSRTAYEHLSSTARGKVRYVGGYAVASLRSKYTKLMKANLYKTDQHGISTYLDSKKILEVLDHFQINEQTLNEITSDPESLHETTRKQNIKRGLTNISDAAYEWFGNLVFRTLHELNSDNLTYHGSKLYEHTLSYLKIDTELFTGFVSLVSSCKPLEHLSCDSDFEVSSLMENIVESVCATETVFCEIIKKVLSILTKQFSKDVATGFEIKKKMEHRKQIKVGIKQKSTKQQSAKQTVAKSTKQQTAAKGSSRSAQRRRTSRINSEPQESISSQMSDSDTSSESEDQTLCHKCEKMYKEGEQWIACDSCEKWYHRSCAGLRGAAKWKLYQSPDKSFFCPDCE